MARKVKTGQTSPKPISKNGDSTNATSNKTKSKIKKTSSRSKNSSQISKSPVIEYIAKDIKLKSSDSDSNVENVTIIKNMKNKPRKRNVSLKMDQDVEKNSESNSKNNMDDVDQKLNDSQIQKGKRKSVAKRVKEPKAPKMNLKKENNSNDVSTLVANGENTNEISDKVASKSLRGRKKVLKEEAGIADDSKKKKTLLTKKEPKFKTKTKPKTQKAKLAEREGEKSSESLKLEINDIESKDQGKSTDSQSTKQGMNNDSSSDSDFEDVEENPQSSKLSNSQNHSLKRKSSDSEMEQKKQQKKQKQCTKTQKNLPNKKKESKPKVTKAKTKKDNSVKTTANTSVLDETDITSVLLRMEGARPSTSRAGGDNSFDSDSGEESDWEEVADHNSPMKSQVPTESVEITIDHPDFMKKKRKKKAFDWKAWVERKIRRFQKDVRIGIHKVQLMCLLSHGMQQNRICEAPTMKAQALSLIPTRLLSRNISMVDIAEVKDLIIWYKSVISFHHNPEQSSRSMVTIEQLEEMFEKKEAVTEKQFVLMFLIILRVLGYDVRMVMSFQPIPLKECTSAKNKLKPPRKKIVRKSPNKTKISENLKLEEKCEKSASKTTIKKENGKQGKKENGKKAPKGKNENGTRKRRASKNIKSYKETESESDSESESFVPDEDDVSSNDSCDNRKSSKSSKGKSPQVKSPKGSHSSSLDEDNSSDFEEEIEFRSPEVVRKNKELKKNRKILSSDSSDDSECGSDVWVEIYLQEEKQWICVDCIREVVNKPYDIESTATYPLHYCLAYSNDDSIKDVTPRYASDWLSTTRKLRVESDWWRRTLQTYRSQEEQNEQDDEQIKDQLIKRPLPTSIAQFKSHPLYVLQRHLLKFEAIYPDSAIPVGYIRSEPIYARECVHVLHSRENWMKEGRAVRIGEEPYKMVKSRPKWNKPKENPDALDLEIFGEWQTDIYIPPPAVDGKIPRNEYGNVELFKPWMLPGGTVHIQVPGLNRIAKKLGLDCVAAMVGWDYHGGFSHALLEGWVVCEEHKDTLMAAWDEDQAIQQEREREKIEKRVYGNWKLLTRGLLIKDRLQTKFDLKKEVEEEKVKEKQNEKKKGKKSKTEIATDAALSWPRRQQTAAQEKKKKNQDHFEVETM